jgi:hypothetical protein
MTCSALQVQVLDFIHVIVCYTCFVSDLSEKVYNFCTILMQYPYNIGGNNVLGDVSSCASRGHDKEGVQVLSLRS